MLRRNAWTGVVDADDDGWRHGGKSKGVRGQGGLVVSPTRPVVLSPSRPIRGCFDRDPAAWRCVANRIVKQIQKQPNQIVLVAAYTQGRPLIEGNQLLSFGCQRLDLCHDRRQQL